jgi:adenosylcobinamide-GDP ribazoletransferase
MLPASLRGMRASFVFMTRLPVGGFPYRPEDFRWASAYFSLVGLVVGGISSWPFLLGSGVGPHLEGCLAVLASMWITGAFHEDGLADTADALGGAHGPKKIFEILKDSRLGTYGTAALVASVLLRVLCLAELVPSRLRWGSLEFSEPLVLWPLCHALSRLGPVGLMYSLPYVSPEGSKGSAVAQGGGIAQLLVAVATCVCATIGAFLAGIPLVRLLPLWALVLVVSLVLGRRFLRAVSGFTGDFLGATEQVLESALLLCLIGTRSQG